MFNMLKWGADWLSTMDQWTTETVTVNGTEILAVIADTEGRLLPGKVPTFSQHTVFLFESTEVASKGIVFRRGTYIVWNDSHYELVAENNRFWSYNDAFKRKIVVKTKHVSITTS